MNFNVTSSGTILSASWDMGDGTSSSQTSFTHKYSLPGVKNVTVILSLSGGQSCTATKTITVYKKPVIRTNLKPDNIYCLTGNRVCITDSSAAGDAGIKMKKRIILWDDGAQTATDDPVIGQTICHSYGSPGTYKIILELTNEKDCKTKKEIVVKILSDVVPDFSTELSPGCDSAQLLIRDNTKVDSTEIVSRTYTWGDGKTTTTKSTVAQHFYLKSGYYRVGLILTFKNGCRPQKDTTVEVFIPEIKFDISINGYRKCYGQSFRFEHRDNLLGAYYRWSIGREELEGKVVDYSPPPGKHKVSLMIRWAGCTKYISRDSIEVVGILPKLTILNDNQCKNQDTVYFCETDIRYGTRNVRFLWDFGDNKAPSCTTSLKNGINTRSNCNYSTDSVARHFYLNGKCRTWILYTKDLDYGCDRVDSGVVNLIRPEKTMFNYSADRFCLGLKPEYKVFFSSDLCPAVKVSINLDSACDRKAFVPWSSYYYYQSVCNKDGYVTVGFAVKWGDKKVYRSWCDTSDYYIDPSRECNDTFWFHHWFRMLPEPFPPFEANGKCIPAYIRPVLMDSLQKNISVMYWKWGDNTKTDTLWTDPNKTPIPGIGHTYKKSGVYTIQFRIENINRCYGDYSQLLPLGYEMAMDFDTVICPGLSVKFREHFQYFFNATDYWHNKTRKAQGKESFVWDFDDGRGFSTDTGGSVIKFPRSGNYRIRLASKDSSGCRDTLVRNIRVGGVYAGIKQITKKIICDDIIQFFDSSRSDFMPPADSIVRYYWEFGDYRNPSSLKDPFHYYKYFGSYTIKHVIENTRGCRDSAYVTLKIDGPVPSFDIVSDTVGCVPFKAEFKNTSKKTKDYIWYFGDPAGTKLSTNRDTNVTFTYTKPGIYYIYLFGNDSVINPNAGNAVYYCKATFPDTSQLIHPIRRIVVLPIPKVDFEVNPVQCLGKPIQVTDRSDSVYKYYRWVIRGVDSIEVRSKTGFLRSGKDTGTFLIRYTPWYVPSGGHQRECYDTTAKPVRITDIKAAFDVIKDTLCPVYTFIDRTRNATAIQWDLGHAASGEKNNIRYEKQVTHNYLPDNGTFYPRLTVVNKYGCRDTIYTEFKVDYKLKAIIPNVFTPEVTEGLNDAYDIVMEHMEEYDLKIFNRWGQLVYKSTWDGVGKDGVNWDGNVQGTQIKCPEGTYFYIFDYKFSCYEPRERVSGSITLIR